jgi:hypothetical protein
MTIYFSPEEITAHQNDVLVDYSHTPLDEQLEFSASSFEVHTGDTDGTVSGVFWYRNAAGKIRIATAKPDSATSHCDCEFKLPALVEFQTARGALINLDSITVPALAGNNSEEVCGV